MAVNIGAVKFILASCVSALGGGAGYLINWPTKSIGAGKMQVLFNRFDFDKAKSPWTSLVHKGSDGNYAKPDKIFDQEIIDLRKSLSEDVVQCINSSGSSEDECCGKWDKIKGKIGQNNIDILRKYCAKKESDEITSENLNSMKGYMAICYDMSEIWYFA